jgi:hypothetical protein
MQRSLIIFITVYCFLIWRRASYLGVVSLHNTFCYSWGAMRWFSAFAILLYVNLLCAPQVFAVHDMRIASLADKQLQALTPSIQPHNIYLTQDSDDEPPTLIASNLAGLFCVTLSDKISTAVVVTSTACDQLPQARGPPPVLSKS